MNPTKMQSRIRNRSIYVERYWRSVLHPLALAPRPDERCRLLVDVLPYEDDEPILAGTKYESEVREKIHILHSRGIFHGDCHIYNLVLLANGSVGFIDFEYTRKIADIPRVESEYHEFLQTEKYGFPLSIEGLLQREMEMPFVR